jgi:adenosylhomocysteine nucleosidase
MVLRTLVTNYLREQAQTRLYEAAQVRNQAAEGEPKEPPPCDVAIVFAVGVEAGGLVDVLTDVVTTRCAAFVEHVGMLGERQVVVVESGVGHAAAALATTEVIALHHVKWVIGAGFATGLDEPLKRGHFLLANEIVDAHGLRIAADLHLRPESLVGNPGLHVGRLLAVEHALRTAEEKHRLGQNHAALAADMESLGIAQACQQRSVPFLAVRIINDGVNDELPPDIERMLDQKSLAGKLGAAAGALWKQPGTIKVMWQLKEDALKASDRLARFLTGVVENLPLSGGRSA